MRKRDSGWDIKRDAAPSWIITNFTVDHFFSIEEVEKERDLCLFNRLKSACQFEHLILVFFSQR